MGLGSRASLCSLRLTIDGLGFGLRGLVCWVYRLGFAMFVGVGLRAYGSGLRAEDLGFRVSGSGVKVCVRACRVCAIHGYLADKKPPPPSDHRRALGTGLLQGPNRGWFLLSEVPLYLPAHRGLSLRVGRGLGSLNQRRYFIEDVCLLSWYNPRTRLVQTL